jgi:hypothetical protein
MDTIFNLKTYLTNPSKYLNNINDMIKTTNILSIYVSELQRMMDGVKLTELNNLLPYRNINIYPKRDVLSLLEPNYNRTQNKKLINDFNYIVARYALCMYLINKIDIKILKKVEEQTNVKINIETKSNYGYGYHCGPQFGYGYGYRFGYGYGYGYECGYGYFNKNTGEDCYTDGCGFDPDEVEKESFVDDSKSYDVKIITRRYGDLKGGGILEDAKLMKNLFPNPEAVLITYMCDPKLKSTRSYLNIYLEHYNQKYRDTANINIFMVNHEIYFCSKEQLKSLTNNDYIMCKSKAAYETLLKYKKENRVYGNKLNYNLWLSYFTSNPKCFSNELEWKIKYPKDFTKVIHIAGKSWMKNTYLILKTYIKYPELGEIKIICRDLCMMQGIFNYDSKGHNNPKEYDEWKQLVDSIKTDPALNKRIKIYSFLEDILKEDGVYDEIITDPTNINLVGSLSSEYVFHRYGINLCPSESEGWGHYMQESKQCGNITVITNFSPFNEFIIDNINGFIIPTYFGSIDDVGVMGRFGISKAKFKLEDLKDVIIKIKSLPQNTLSEISKKASESFIYTDIKFKSTFKKFILDNWYNKQIPLKTLKDNLLLIDLCNLDTLKNNIVSTIDEGFGKSTISLYKVNDDINQLILIKTYYYLSIEDYTNKTNQHNIEIDILSKVGLINSNFLTKVSPHIINIFDIKNCINKEIVHYLTNRNLKLSNISLLDEYKYCIMEYSKYGSIQNNMEKIIKTDIQLKYMLFQIFYTIFSLYYVEGISHNDLTIKNILLFDDINYVEGESKVYKYSFTDSTGEHTYYIPVQPHIVKIIDFDSSTINSAENKLYTNPINKKTIRLNNLKKLDITHKDLRMNAYFFENIVLAELYESTHIKDNIQDSDFYIDPKIFTSCKKWIKEQYNTIVGNNSYKNNELLDPTKFDYSLLKDDFFKDLQNTTSDVQHAYKFDISSVHKKYNKIGQDIWEQKYLKYKNKYNNLKKMLQ